MSFIRGGRRNTATVLWKHGCSRLPLQTRLRITSEILAGKHTYIAIGYFSKCIKNSWTDRLRGGALSNLPWLRGKTKNKCQGMIKAWKVVLDLEWAWRTTMRDLALWKENNGVTYDFVLPYSACLSGVLSVFVGEFPTGRRAGTSAVVWREAVSLTEEGHVEEFGMIEPSGIMSAWFREEPG